VLFPVLPSQRQGIEDTRLVRFCEDDGSIVYHGTYTAFSGGEVRSELLTTTDFRSFEMRVLTGQASSGKGMALFLAALRVNTPCLDVRTARISGFISPIHCSTGKGAQSLLRQITLGIRADGQLRIADRNRRRMVGDDPRRWHGAQLLHWRMPPRQE
jgi:hypothetical protein